MSENHFPVKTSDGETHFIVNKYVGSQDETILVDAEGNEYLPAPDGPQGLVVPREEDTGGSTEAEQDAYGDAAGEALLDDPSDSVGVVKDADSPEEAADDVDATGASVDAGDLAEAEANEND